MKQMEQFSKGNDVRVLSIERVGCGEPVADWEYDVTVNAYGDIERYYRVCANGNYRSFRNALIKEMNRINIDNDREAEDMFREANYMG